MSLLRLQELDGTFLIYQYGVIRRSPLFEHLFEIECMVRDLTEVGAPHSKLWIPLTEFAHHPVGSLVGRRAAKMVVSATKQRAKPFSITNNYLEFEASRTFAAKLFQPPQTVEVMMPPPCLAYLNDSDGGTSCITSSEMLRFYLSSCSALIDHLLLAKPDYVPPLTPFIDSKNSGWETERCLVLTPRREFLGRSTIFQLAIFLTDPELWTFVHWSLFRLRYELTNKPETAPFMAMRDEDLKLTVETEHIHAKLPNGSTRPLDLVGRIVADHRPAQFDELVVRVPLSEEEAPMPRPPFGTSSTKKEPTGPVTGDTWIMRAQNASQRTFRIGATNSQFSRCFPDWKKVRIRVDRPATGFGGDKKNSTGSREGEPEKEASTAPGTRSGLKRRVSYVQADEFEPSKTPPTFETTNFAPLLVPEMLSAISVPIPALPPMMRCFHRASTHLFSWHDMTVSPIVAAKAGEAVLFSMPPAWGGIARLSSRKFPRVISAIPLELDSGFVWAIEIGRRGNHEEFSVGLAAPTEGDDQLQFLARVMCGVCARTATLRGEDPKGTWPDAYYPDVRFSHLVHTAARAHYINLAHAILARAHYLLRPDDDA
jgi:hypothetical protein